MLLDRIDIDAHGPLQRVQLGPFCERVNVVCGPQGSGKTAIARFIRDSLVHRDYPLGMLSSSSGRVVWADRSGMVHCRREKDGTAHGRRSMEFEPRGDFDLHFDAHQRSWIDGITGRTADGHVAASIRLPESIVDGVMTDTSVSSVARVVAACTAIGIDSHEIIGDLPLHEDSVDHQRNGEVVPQPASQELQRRLRAELAEVDAELTRLGGVADDDALVARRNRIASRLSRPSDMNVPRDRSQHLDWNQRLNRLHQRARQLRAEQSELRRWISEIDRDIARTEARYSPASARYGESPYRAAIADEDLRRQLDDLDKQMIRWRRALLEVRGLRQALLARHDPDASQASWPTDETSLRRMRLEGFLHAIDRYDRSRNWDELYPESYRPLYRIDDIDHRIDSATRQIDWLLSRYTAADKPQSAWYESVPESIGYRSASTLGDALRAIRDDLRHVQRYTSQGQRYRSYATAGELEELRHCQQWLVASIERLNRHRESLLHQHATAESPESEPWSLDQRYDRDLLSRERSSSIARLDRVTVELDACLGEAAEVRRSMRSVPDVDWRVGGNADHDWIDREALIAEMRSIDDRLATSSRARWLRARRSQLLDQLGGAARPVRPVSRSRAGSPLAELASRWLVRLSAGRMRRIDWPMNRFDRDDSSYHRDRHQRTGVTMDGRDESDCAAVDRALAAMAVRLAAGDLLARTGRHIPLVFETHRELFSTGVGRADRSPEDPAAAFFQQGEFTRNHPIAAAISDYASSGRQVIVLTSSHELTAQLSRAGARTFQMHAERIVHPHRPLWQPHYDGESYVGPHPHTYGSREADDSVFGAASRSAPDLDINRDFDMAWREAYGLYDNPDQPRRGRSSRPKGDTSQRTEWARGGVEFRDGYYFADTYTTTTAAPAAGIGSTDANARAASGGGRKASQAKASPFFLSVDSPIDQAPSVDAVAAARLRGVSVTHITHLMQQDPCRLADALGLADVDAATIRRWQAECRLVCRVPQLRGFDARVLVGCGVTTPAELASTHPVDLLQEVQAFLATPRGEQILLSGSSHEVSRITSWIAAGHSTAGRDFVTFGRHAGESRGRRRRSGIESGFDSDRYEYEDGSARGLPRRRRRQRSETENNGQRRASGSSRRSRTSRDRNGQGNAAGSGSRSTSRNGNRRRDRRQRRVVQRDQATAQRRASGHRQTQPETVSEDRLRFYLQRDSDVVDAPSIGSRMAERLNEIGIYTVNDLLVADPETTASELDHRRVSADTVLQWQQQATLVCRVPMLRGHDAQLLVAGEITTPEQLADFDAEELFGIIDPIARSSEGKRIVRGGHLPDLDEVSGWISYAQHQRQLRAA